MNKESFNMVEDLSHNPITVLESPEMKCRNVWQFFEHNFYFKYLAAILNQLRFRKCYKEHTLLLQNLDRIFSITHSVKLNNAL